MRFRRTSSLCVLVLVVAWLTACRNEAPGEPVTAAPPPSREPQPVAQPSLPATDVAAKPIPPHSATSTPTGEVVAGDSAACRRVGIATPPPSQAVHRWVDADGITHYSDREPPPGARGHRVIDVHGLPAISVEATGYDTGLPDQMQQRAVADALGVQRVMHDALGVAIPVGMTLRVVFVKDEDTYARLLGDPQLAGSAGAYSPARHTIFVRLQPRDEDSFAILRHEMTHALVHESVGNLPTPVNEGLAEYLGRYQVAGLGGQIAVGANRQALVVAAPAGDGTDALVDLLARDGHSFYEAGTEEQARERRYLRAYALVATLMGSAQGRSALTAVLAAQYADACTPVAVERVFEKDYPGGLAALASAWAAFMRNPPDTVQAY